MAYLVGVVVLAALTLGLLGIIVVASSVWDARARRAVQKTAVPPDAAKTVGAVPNRKSRSASPLRQAS